MALSIGIVGLPNVGKSTLFNALTKKAVPAENYPFCTIDPSVGIVAVPDNRLEKLSTLSNSAKTIPPAVEFVDIAGLVKGAAEGEGLGNKFLSNIRETDAILEVVRIFEDDNIIHVHGSINPISDIEVINAEISLADLETVQKRKTNVERDAKRGDKNAVAELRVIEKIEASLLKGERAERVSLSEDEKKTAKGLHLLSLKPVLYAFNKKAGGKNLDEMGDMRWRALLEFLKKEGNHYVLIDANIENELKDFEGEEKESMRRELAKDADDGINALIKESYALLGLMTFFTTGEDETRGWTIAEGSPAPIAGVAIHTDFKDKFIRAEVISSKDLLTAGSYVAARTRGLVRTEGKEYIVKDGDVMEFKI